MRLSRYLALLSGGGLLISGAPLAAQQATRREVDSLAAEVRALRAQLDSLHAMLPANTAPPQAAATADTDTSLASLRASAAQAAGIDTTATGPDTTTAVRFVGRERNQAQLNPEIGATGDVRAYAQSTGPQHDNFDPREFEVGFQSALDPYSHTKIFVSLENGNVDIEEGYAYWIGLPGRLRVDVGKFRQQFGELNRWHLHALPETEYPLVVRSFMGPDGLVGTGLSLYRAFGGFGTHELTAQLTESGSDALLFGGSARPTGLLHLLNFWQLTPSTYLQIGASGLYGTNPDSALKTSVAGLEFRYTWRPAAQALYKDWTLRGEIMWLHKSIAGVGPTRVGGYIGTTYKLGERWIVGARWDDVQDPRTGLVAQELVPSLTLWESEWVYLRLQYTWSKLEGADATGQLAFQTVWAIGPHKHETY